MTVARRRVAWLALALCAALAATLLINVASGRSSTPDGYTTSVFSDGFESGDLSAWNGPQGTGSVSVSGTAAHGGAYGAEIVNGSGQYGLLVKTLPQPLEDSLTTFWAHVSAGGGVQTLAQGRDSSSSQTVWSLLYDPSRQGLYFYPATGSGSTTEIFTGSGTVPLDTWFQVQVQFTAQSAGGARLYVNGQTSPGWGVSGDYSRTSNYQKLQLWDDSGSTTCFDDVSVAVPPPSVPGAPTGVQGSAKDGAVALSWTAPADDGGAQITSYRITPYVGGVAQTPLNTGSAGTSHTVELLSNGTAYTFTVAAITAAGLGATSDPSAPVTPAPASAPDAPSAVQATAYDGAAAVSWSPPADNGGAAVTSYRVTPYVDGAPQKAVSTNSTDPALYMTGLNDGTAYTFTVAAINKAGTGLDSSPSPVVTPAPASSAYTTSVFSDGFESGDLSAWNGPQGTGSVSVSGTAAHGGAYGAQIVNGSGQYGLLVKTLPQPLEDSQTTFWARVIAGGGVQTLAEGRDSSSSQTVWSLLYDPSRQGLYFDPATGSGSITQIFTGPGSVPVGTWFQVQVQFAADSAGGAQLYIDGKTTPDWKVSGNYSRASNYQRLQLWDDSGSTTYFDDVSVAVPPPSVPGAPTAVQGSAKDGAVALSWTAPADDGGAQITSYRITPYVGGVAQAPIDTGSAATSHTVDGLSDGTAYTFTVAASNAVGTGATSDASAAVTPVPASVPGAPANVQGTAYDGAVALNWSAPSDDGGAAVTGYRVTPYVAGTAQQALLTGSADPELYVTGLSDGTAYTFTVAAVNKAGTGTDSSPSASITPAAPQTKYTNSVFSDGFESGTLNAWTGPQGTGTVSVGATAAHSGSDGAQITNGSGQYGLLVKTLPQPLVDSQTTFWARVSSGGGLQTLAQGRDSTSSQTVWSLLYDPNRQGLYFYPATGAGSATEIFTGSGSVPVGTWFQVQVQFTAENAGGARLYIDGQTSTAWAVSGNYSRASNYQRLQLWNDSGATTYFDDVSVATPPPAVPGAPTQASATAKDGAAALSWTAPTDDGGAQITSYRITPYVGAVAQAPIDTGSATTSHMVDGLRNGTAYTFTVAASNGVGTGAASDPSAAVTPVPASAPEAPSGVLGTAYDGAVAVSWSPPADDGGTPVTGYRVTPYLDGTAQNALFTNSADPELYVPGLSDGTAYTFAVAAINKAGTGPDSSGSPSVIPAAVPTVYTTSVFSDDFESGTLNAWNGPQGTGAVSVAATAAHSGSDGTQITNGSGQYGLLVKTLPAPLDDSQTTFWARVTSGGRLQTLAQARDSTSSQTVWSLLYDPGKQGLYFYPATGSGSTTEIFTGSGSVPVGTWFQVQVQFTAENPGGARLYVDGQTSTAWAVSGNYSRTSNFQKLQLWNDSGATTYFDDVAVATTPPDTDSVPSAASGLTGTARDGSVALSWTVPASDGGNPITNYLVTPYIDGVPQTPMVTTPSAQDSYTVQGLRNGTAYTFTVAAINGLGTGPVSNVTSLITPQAAALPSAPTGLAGAARDGAVGLSWSAPANDGGGTITGYRVTPYAGGTAQTPFVTSSPATTYVVPGLDNGTPYTFTVAAINKAGTGPDSGASTSVTPAPAIAPGFPTEVQGIAHDAAVALSWTAPSSDGGSPITAYRVTPYLGGTAQTPTTFSTGATSGTVTGLTNGLAYTFTVSAISQAGPGPESPASSPVTPVPPNPIQLENEQPGDPNWYGGVAPPNPLDIAGYASKVSVNHGDSVDFFVSTTAASVGIDVFRMGWYNGAGARLMESMGSFPGVDQAQGQPDRATGMVSENWSKTATLNVPSGWTSGVYLARLDASDGYTSYVTFVVRDDGGSEPILFQASTNTYEAYNSWGGTSLYNNNTDGTAWPYPHALKVSFDRPFLNGNGTGDFLRWEYPFIRWLEKNGYDAAYTTDTDTGTDPGALTGHKTLLVVGHDEYWSQGQRENVQNAIAAGVNVAFFAGNEAWWQVRYEPNAAGAPDRVMDGYKDFADCSCDGGPDPEYGVNNSLVTTHFQDPLVGQPEDAMMGESYGGEAVNAPYIVTDASSWVFAGTGWTNGTSVPGIVGYEYDHYSGDSTTPAGTSVLSSTPVVNTENGQSDTANSTLYTAPSGATVFAAGTIQWSWGLDGWYSTGAVSSGIQQATNNILQRFTGQSGLPGGFGGT